MTLSITPGRSVDVDEVIDGLAPRDPAVEAEFLAAFYRFHREKTGEREATTRESLNKILSRSGKDFDVYGLYRGCCQRGGFHSRAHVIRRSVPRDEQLRRREHVHGHREKAPRRV